MSDMTPAEMLTDVQERLVRVENAVDMVANRLTIHSEVYVTRFDGLETQLNNLTQMFSQFYDQAMGFLALAQQKMGKATSPGMSKIQELLVKRAMKP